MHTMLVTGGAGFIGGAFVRMVVAEGRCKVVNLDKLTYAGNLASLCDLTGNPQHVFVQGDIADRALLDALLKEHRPQSVVNFAAESHVDRSIDGPRAFLQTNVVGTFELLDAARIYWQSLPIADQHAFRLLHISTDEVFGSLGSAGQFSETSPYAPNSPYAASKAAGDHWVRAYFHTYGLPTLITHCSNNYGPYQFPEKLLPLMILNAVAGKKSPVYGDGQQVRDWLHVEDHCRALRLVLEKGRPGTVYNIGGFGERTNLEVVRMMCRMVDELRPQLPHIPTENLIAFVADRPGHDRRYSINSTKIQNELGWHPLIDFEAGLRQTIEWYLNHSDWVSQIVESRYRLERLGLGGQQV